MKIAYVAGFFSQVKTDLEKSLSSNLNDRSVVWIPQLSSSGHPDLRRFAESFFDAIARGATDVLLLIFVFREAQGYILEVITSIVDEGKQRSPMLNVQVCAFKNARDSAGVISAIFSFGPKVGSAPPTSLLGFEQWVLRNLKGKVILHPRAANAVKKSQYGDIPLIYRSIELLGKEYRDMRMTKPESAGPKRGKCDLKLAELGLELSQSITPSQAGEYGTQYFVTYPGGSEKKRMLDQHLKKGADRDERYCLRIYFFWDEDVSQVVIGWLPSHLDTAMS